MAEYNPNIKYRWENDTQFSLTGNEFGIILNTFRTILSSPEAQRILMLNTANEAVESILKKNVEAGIIKPVQEEDDSPSTKLKRRLTPLTKVEDDNNNKK